MDLNKTGGVRVKRVEGFMHPTKSKGIKCAIVQSDWQESKVLLLAVQKEVPYMNKRDFGLYILKWIKI